MGSSIGNATKVVTAIVICTCSFIRLASAESYPEDLKGVKNKTAQPKKLYPPCTLALLTIFIKDEEYDDFFDHFEEAFEKRRKRSGLTAARLWVWKQVFITIGPLIWRVVRGAVALWRSGN
ncbi:MAG TPA: hypothetical protein VGB77_22250 [Abditibacteriaceae bacterium]